MNYLIAERFPKAVKLVRSALAGAGLSIAGEIDVSASRRAHSGRILLVDCPLLMFEAQALNRAAGVFVPLHILLCADGEGTLASTANSAEFFNGRLPLGAAAPVERLRARVESALASLAGTEIGQKLPSEQ